MTEPTQQPDLIGPQYCEVCGGTIGRGPSDGDECQCAAQDGENCPTCLGSAGWTEPHTALFCLQWLGRSSRNQTHPKGETAMNDANAREKKHEDRIKNMIASVEAEADLLAVTKHFRDDLISWAKSGESKPPYWASSRLGRLRAALELAEEAALLLLRTGDIKWEFRQRALTMLDRAREGSSGNGRSDGDEKT